MHSSCHRREVTAGLATPRRKDPAIGPNPFAFLPLLRYKLQNTLVVRGGNVELTRKIGILGTGVYLPEAVLTNKDLEKMVETTSQWIVERSGIHERRIAAPDENTVTMAVAAGRQALQAAGIKPEQLSYIVLGTNTPAQYFPAGAIRVQEELGTAGRPRLSTPGGLLRLQLRPVCGGTPGGSRKANMP